MDKPLVEKAVYSLAELCHLTSLSRSCIYQEIRKGRLKAVKRGRRTLVLQVEVRRWLESLPAAVDSSSEEP